MANPLHCHPRKARRAYITDIRHLTDTNLLEKVHDIFICEKYLFDTALCADTTVNYREKRQITYIRMNEMRVNHRTL